MLILLLALAQTTTTCNTVAGVTRCTERSTSQPDYQGLLDAVGPPKSSTPPGSTPHDRASEQLSQLVADNRCDDAKRVAKFYGYGDLVKRVARACP